MTARSRAGQHTLGAIATGITGAGALFAFAGLSCQLATAAIAAEPRSSIAFALADRAALGALTAGFIDPGRARPHALALTDLMLEITAPGGGDAAAALAADAEPSRGRRRGLFRIRLLAVAGGRLRADASGWCSHFRVGESRCEIDCDGGLVILRRGGSGLEMEIATGASADADEGLADSRGVALTACRAHEDGDIRLLPASGRSNARLPFIER